ncbi:hypothetical protein STRAU_0532 [Streptomyces aurantiacus JA 4570]|uniref:Uncharacterized protein n=1 Tax=Streptomyces aurantiacus JA 4570 TaxID=1286094 RepID=S3ZSI3_9ACTN|nr:hypothetical protein STRAU_0532 [Streptomyces aurantiacus JA 4570]
MASKNADAVMRLYAADLVSREVLTPSGLALARKLMQRESAQH